MLNIKKKNWNLYIFKSYSYSPLIISYKYLVLVLLFCYNYIFSLNYNTYINNILQINCLAKKKTNTFHHNTSKVCNLLNIYDITITSHHQKKNGKIISISIINIKLILFPVICRYKSKMSGHTMLLNSY